MHGVDDTTEYYFNTQTRMVEKGRLSAWEHLMGPYPSPDEAARAFDLAQERTDAWDQEDAQWRGEEE